MQHPHLFVDISSHGFGHLSQVAPVLNALVARLPSLRLTIRSGLPVEKLRARIFHDFAHLPASTDFGYVMHDAVSFDLPATELAYRKQHANWEQKVAEEAALQAELAPQLVFTDVAYLPLAGAARLGIPAISMCSLNWADLFAHYFGAQPWASPIHAQMLAAYNSAACFLRTTPGMPMADFHKVREIGPIAALGQEIRDDLRRRLACTPQERIVLIAFGGVGKRLPLEEWPKGYGVRWLVPASWQINDSSTDSIESLGYDFTDLLRAVDVVLTKPGYGTFAEAACNGTRLLYVRRDDWPEQDCLIEWVQATACCHEISADDLEAGRLREPLARLLVQSMPPPPLPQGAEQAAEVLFSTLTENAAGTRRCAGATP